MKLLSSLVVALASGVAAAQTALPVSAPVPAMHRAYPKATPLGRKIAALVGSPTVSRAHWGVAVTEMDGTPIFGVNEAQFFLPASNNKLFTTAVAMALLGANATVTTTVTTTGTVDADGVLHGDLVLHGAGDANLSGRVLPYQSAAVRRALTANGESVRVNPLAALEDLAAQIQARGIHKIEGSVIADNTLWPWEPYGREWSVDDVVWGYGAPVTPLVVNDNEVDVTLQPASKLGDAASISVSPDLGTPRFSGSVTTVRKADGTDVKATRVDAIDSVRLGGSVAQGGPDEEAIAVSPQASFAAKAFASALQHAGVTASNAATDDQDSSQSAKKFVCADCTPIASRVSAPLVQDVAVTLKESLNLHADLMLKRLGMAFGNQGTFEEGDKVVRRWLLHAGIDGGDFVFYDGSGLSSHDLVTPRAVASLLAYSATQPWFPQWKAALPVGGVDGTLTSRFTKPPLKGKVFAKTGTHSEARALSGYLECASGKTVIFSILVDTHLPGSSADRDVMDKIVEAIASAN